MKTDLIKQIKKDIVNSIKRNIEQGEFQIKDMLRKNRPAINPIIFYYDELIEEFGL